jgi:hypothetical protein
MRSLPRLTSRRVPEAGSETSHNCRTTSGSARSSGSRLERSYRLALEPARHPREAVKIDAASLKTAHVERLLAKGLIELRADCSVLDATSDLLLKNNVHPHVVSCSASLVMVETAARPDYDTRNWDQESSMGLRLFLIASA